MKNKMAILMAFICAAGTVFAASAADTEIPEGDRYKKVIDTPYCYFRVGEAEGVQLAAGNKVYINKKAVTDEVVIPAEVCYYDRLNKTWMLACRVLPEDAEVVLSDFRLPEEFPFNISSPILKTFNRYDKCGINLICQNDSPLNVKPMETTGEKTDDYPLCLFNCRIAADTPSGKYSVGTFDEGSYNAYADIRYQVGEEVSEYSISHCSGTLDIYVGDRDIGDVDRNGTVDEEDAEKILDGYAAASNTDSSGFTQGAAIAADVNFDGEVNAEDAELIMDYSLSGVKMLFSDYLKENMK